MTREEAIRILDPATTAEALAEIEYYAGFRGKEAEIEALDEASMMAVAALREREQLEQGCEYCNEGESICNRDEDIRISGNILRIDIGCYAYSSAKINFCPMCGRRLPQPLKGE